MKTKNAVFQNVYGTKAVSLLGDEGWDIAGNKEPAVWSQLAWPYRGLTVISDKVASLPFEILKNGEVVDSSEDYQNYVGFLPDLKRLLWLLTASQTLTGAAYAFSDNVGLMRKRLRYILKESVKEIKFQDDGTIIIIRESKVNGVMAPRPYKGGVDIIYFWMPDPGVEAGPPNSAPMLAAMAAAGVLHGMDTYIRLYWEKGAIKASVFVTDGNMPDDQQENLKNWYKRTISGIKNAFNLGIFNGSKGKFESLGDGIEGLKDTELTKEKREDISTALGIPQSILFSTGASGIGGGGVVDSDMIKFLTDTIIPRAEALAEIFNTQVFNEASGYKLVFRPQKLAIYQKDEAQRAAALNSLSSYIRNMASQGIDPALGFDLLGYPLSDNQKQALMTAWNSKKTAPAPVTQTAQIEENPAIEKTPAVSAENIPVKGLEDLRKWQRKAIKHIGDPVKFESDEIPLTVSEFIRLGLKDCADETQVKSLFARAENSLSAGGFMSAQDDSAVRELAQAITQATKAVDVTPPVQPVINVTVNLPDGKSPDVVTNVQ